MNKKNYKLTIDEDGQYGWTAIVTREEDNEVILDSSYYGSFPTRELQKDILRQFRRTLKIKKFKSVDIIKY